MKHPLFRAEAIRDTNAPFAVVKKALQDKADWARWSIAPRATLTPLVPLESGGVEIGYTQSGPLGLNLQGTLRATPAGPRVLLEHRATLRGWAILLLLGWYRWRIEGMWERFIQGLPAEEAI